jgi:hypothetical protein
MKKIFLAVAFLSTAMLSAQKGIELNLEVGKTYTLASETTTQVKQVMGGMPQEQTTISTEETDFVITGKKEGNYLIDIIPTKVRNETKSMGQSTIQDSEGDTTDPMNMIMKNLTNRTMKAVVSTTGELVEFNANGYTDAMMEGVEMDDMMKLQMEGAMKAELTDQKLKQSYLKAFQALTNSKKKKGATWSTTNDMEMMMVNMDVDNQYTIKDMTEGRIMVTSDGTISTGGEQEAMIQGMTIKMTMDGDAKGEITIDEKTGWLINSVTDGNLKGKMVFPAGLMGPDPMPVDMEVTTTAIVKGMKKK